MSLFQRRKHKTRTHKLEFILSSMNFIWILKWQWIYSAMFWLLRIHYSLPEKKLCPKSKRNNVKNEWKLFFWNHIWALEKKKWRAYMPQCIKRNTFAYWNHCKTVHINLQKTNGFSSQNLNIEVKCAKSRITNFAHTVFQ